MRLLMVLIALSVFLSGCNGYKRIDTSLDLGQNWGVKEQKVFYQTTQGSQIIKYTWFLALEQPESETLFLADKLQRFGYLADLIPSTPEYNPDNLPIGFVRDNDAKGAWMGMTCAACHTSEIFINGQAVRIDGAPTNADFVSFIKELSAALSATATDPEKFSRFVERVNQQSERLKLDQQETADLWQELVNKADSFAQFFARNRPDPEQEVMGGTKFANIPGQARLDAVGFIVNEIAFTMLPINENLKIPNAPVSYPFLWDTHQQRRVQWNGVSNGALSRNTTEVLGVFAKFNPHKPKLNSVNLENLQTLEETVEQLRSPRWEDAKFGLPAIDNIPERKAKGKALYELHCQRCHSVLDRSADQPRNVPIKLNPLGKESKSISELDGKLEFIGTDRLMADNFDQRRVTIIADEGAMDVPAALGIVLPKIWSKSLSAFLTGAIQALSGESVDNLLVYKARPLDGVWATAPYLHNGSVANMMELLKPADERAEKFCVGSRDFDSNLLGFDSKLNSSGGCGENFLLDTSIIGNSNRGHEYGTENDPNVKNGDWQALNHQDRLDIIEFIKAE